MLWKSKKYVAILKKWGVIDICMVIDDLIRGARMKKNNIKVYND